MGVQISQICGGKKKQIDENSMNKIDKQLPLKQNTLQIKDNSSKSNQSIAKVATNAQINEILPEQIHQNQNLIILEDQNNKRIFRNNDIQKQETNTHQRQKSMKMREEIVEQFISISDDEKCQIDDFNRGFIFHDDVNSQNSVNKKENLQNIQNLQKLQKLEELNQIEIKNNPYRALHEKQNELMDQIMNGKQLKEFEDDSDADSEGDEPKTARPNKKRQNKDNKGYRQRKNENKEGSSEDENDDEIDEDDEEIDEDDEDDQSESYDIFDSNGLLGRLSKEKRNVKNVMGLDQLSGQTYVVKQFSPEEVEELQFDEELAIKIRRLQINNLCLCQTHAIGFDENEGMQIVQNHEKGGSLSLFIETAFSDKEAKVWMVRILKALLVLHNNNIVHGNLKPNNILLGKGVVKLTDINMFKNTQYLRNLYSAPEVLKSNQLTEKSDIWSLCLIFIEQFNKSDFIKKMRIGFMPYLKKDPNMTVEKLQQMIEKMDLILPFDQDTLNFVKMMYQIKPEKRKSVKELLNSKYLINENTDVSQYLTQLEFKRTQKKLNITNNFDGSVSKPLQDYWMQKSLGYNGEISTTHKGILQKGTTTFYDKVNDKSIKQYGITSLLTVVNLKEKEYQQQDSYMPISVANLMLTTQLTKNGGGLSQLLPKDESSMGVNSKHENPTNNELNKSNSIKEKQTTSTNLTSTNLRQQLASMKTGVDEIKEDIQVAQYQKQEEECQKIIKQQQEEEEESEDDEQNSEDEGSGTKKHNKQKNSPPKQNNQKKMDNQNKNNNSDQKQNNQKQLVEILDAEVDVMKKQQQQNEIEQQLLDILNQQLDGEGSTSFIGQGSQDLDRSFEVKDEKHHKSSLQEVPLVVSNNISHQNKKQQNLNQQQSIQLHSPSQQKIRSQYTGLVSQNTGLVKNPDILVEEMNRILNDHAGAFSNDSFEEIKRQISTQNFHGLKKMLTMSSQQKTSNSIKTQRTLGQSQILRNNNTNNNRIKLEVGLL